MIELLLITMLFGGICFGALVVTAALLYKFSKEEHRKGFFDVNIKGWKMRNLALNIFLSPIYWFIQLGIILGFSILLLAFMLEIPYYSPLEALLTFFGAGAISLAATLLYALFVWLLDYKDREPIKFFPTLFLWGCMAAIMAFFTNTLIDTAFWLTMPELLVTILTPTFVAPVVEEFFKGSGLYLISRSKRFSGITDGIVYGFIIGMGFAFIEDWAYYTQYAPMDLGVIEWIHFIFLRSVLTGAAHGILTATTGIFLGIGKMRNTKTPWFWLVLGLLCAMTLHGVFNGLSLVDWMIYNLLGFEGPLLMIFMGLLLVGLALVLVKSIADFKPKRNGNPKKKRKIKRKK